MRSVLFLLLLSRFVLAQTPVQEQIFYFDSNAYSLTEEQKSTLTSLFSSEENTQTEIVVYGFCDDVGTEESNLVLSQKRAKAVTDFLQDELQIKVTQSVGKGEIPLPGNLQNTDEIRRNNRIAKIIYSKEVIPAKVTPSETKNLSNYKTFSDELRKGDRIIMKNLLFLGSLTQFRSPEEAEAELQEVITYLNSHPNTKIEIQGHVCCITNSFADAYDRISQKNNLSKTRAKKVYDYLVEKGISPNRMTHEGYGRRFPIPGGEEGDNKRVEILIVED